MGTGAPPLVVWVTRARPGAEETAERLRRLGHTPLVAPVLEVRPLGAAIPDLGRVGAIAFTSANGVRAFARASPYRDRPVFVTGEATAAAARMAGFGEVLSAGGEVAALARLVIGRRATFAGAVLHPCATQAAGDLKGALGAAGVEVLALPLYETTAVEACPAAVAEALAAGRLAVVMAHSPKAARVLARLLDGAPTDEVALVGLSLACLAPLAALPFARRAAAEAPNEAALLALLHP